MFIGFLKGLQRFIKVTGILAGVFFLFFMVAGMGVYFYFSWDLPDLKNIEDYRPAVATQVFAQDGTPIGEFWTERRILTPVDKVPPMLINAFLAAEDARFYEHHGVDFRGVLRAFWSNVRAHEFAQGGSTITQQITRSLLLTREKSIARKVKEAILATRIERSLNKDQILYLYLNQIYFGNRAYGVAAASQNYFHKELDQMNLAEISILGGLPRAPQIYSPLKNPVLARERQNYVLTRMVETGAISKKQQEEALKTEVTLFVAGTDKEQNLQYAPHFMEYLRLLLRQKYGEDLLYHGGLKIRTTLDPKLQKAAVAAVRKGVEALDRRQGWRGVAGHIEPSEIPTFREKLQKEMVASIYGNQIRFPESDSKEAPPKVVLSPDKKYKAVVTGFEENQTLVAVGRINGIIPHKLLQWARPYNTNVAAYEEAQYVSDPRNLLKIGDVVWVKPVEDSGRTFWLFQEPRVEGALYSMEPATGNVRAVVGGYDFSKSEFNRATQAMRQPGSSFKPFVYTAALDKGYTFRTIIDDSPITLQVSPTEVWSPENYEGRFRGPTPFRDCLVHSRNVPTVKIARDISTEYVAAYARKMGLTSPIHKYLSMALGANDVYLHQMVAAYSIFPNSGVYRPPIYVTQIEDASNQVMEKGPIALEVPDEASQPTEIELDVKALKKEELNTGLFLQNQHWIDQDKLKLSPQELKVLYGANIPKDHVITPRTAFLMTELLSEVVQHGTGWKVRELKRPVAGKTGTTNDETDTWFIGFTPHLSAGVWVGFDDPAKKIGKKEAGGRTAAPIFLDYMKAATDGTEVADFKVPEGLNKKDIWAMTGGSALFAEHKPLPEPPGAATLERSVDFFEQDLEGMAPAPPKQSAHVPESFDKPAPEQTEESDPGF